MDDAQLLQHFRDPKTRQSAFNALLQRYQARVYAHLYRMVGQAEDAADLTQEVFVRVWNKLDGFEGRSKLYTWIYRIATNEALAHLEKRRRLQPLALEEYGFSRATEPFAAEDLDPEAIARYLRQAMDTLPPRQRQVFLLRYYDEMPYQDMAVVLQTSEGALKATYHHAVQKIQQQLLAALARLD
jgi:RNA polymerase sigma-70 factor (ECF subfamily)